MQAIAIYGTVKEVRLLDRRLGILHIICLSLVVGYVVGIRGIVEKGYQSLELNNGMIALKLNGVTFTTSGGINSPADEADLVTPVKEGAALFLPLTKVTNVGQILGNCTDAAFPCTADSDCAPDPPLSSGLCEGGFCWRSKWCADPPTAEPVTSELSFDSLGNLSITLLGTISFPHLADEEQPLTTEDNRSVTRQTCTGAGTTADPKVCQDTQVGPLVTWPLRTDPDNPSLIGILERSQIPLSELTNGAVLSLVLKWSCYLGFSGGFSHTCLPRLRVYDISPKNHRFSLQWADYYKEISSTGTPVQRRDLHNATGLRFLVTSRGNARKVDPYACVIQLFILLALLPIAGMLADTIMQNAFSERRHYREYKTETTPDFSDVRAKVEQLDQQTKSQQEKLLSYGEGDV